MLEQVVYRNSVRPTCKPHFLYSSAEMDQGLDVAEGDKGDSSVPLALLRSVQATLTYALYPSCQIGVKIASRGAMGLCKADSMLVAIAEPLPIRWVLQRKIERG